MASLDEHGSACGVSSVGLGLTTSTSDRDFSGYSGFGKASKELELTEWMARIQDTLLSMEAALSAQATAMQQLMTARGQLSPVGGTQKAAPPDEAPCPAPCGDPPALPAPNVLGRVVEQSEESGEGLPSDEDIRRLNEARRRSRRSSGDGRVSQALDSFLAARDPQSSQYGMMLELEEHTAFRLLHTRRKGRSHSNKRSGRVSPLSDRDDSLSTPSPSKRRAPTITSRAGTDDKEAMLSRVRRVSLEDLRNNYDAVLVSKARMPQPSWTSAHATALNSVAWFLLCMAGILQFKEGRLWRLLSWFSFAIFPAAAATALTWFAVTAGADISVVITLCCFVAGAVLATLSLQRDGISLLLGPAECALDDYATESGFLRDWWKVSRWRAMEVAAVLFGSLVAKALLNLFFTRSLFTMESAVERATGWLYWILSFYYMMLCYVHLHICCGLELAVDSFGLRFFKDMDMDQALEEWNQVQATLRQVSRKQSGSLLMLGSACMACLAILAEKVIQNGGSFLDPVKLLPWVGWFYPLILLYLYTMLRAAAITEKAGRVAPLINAWTFQDQDEDGEQQVCWMDLERQYVVQYINQSEAGFYIRGSRLSAFNVQKMAYYFAAFSFALFSQISATSV